MSGGPGMFMIGILNKFCIYSIPMSGGPGVFMIGILMNSVFTVFLWVVVLETIW